MERISTHGLLPTNVAFALPGQHRIHVTEFQHGQVEVFPVSRDGLPFVGRRKESMRGWLSERAYGRIPCREKSPGCGGF